MTNETVTITQTEPDGTETVIEITQAGLDENVGDSLVEEVIEAIFDAEPDADFNESAGVFGESDVDLTTNDVVEMAIGSEPVGADETTFSATEQTDGSFIVADSASTSPEGSVGDGDSQSHADAAEQAQAAADEFVASGDYEAASQAREAAENEASEAGDSSMLHGSDSTDLDNAAYQQQNADYYEQQETLHAQQGDYEAAREDASNAAYAQGDADFNAGGSDHTGQAKAEETQMDWAVWEEGNAEYNAQSAEEYAAAGDLDNAEQYAAAAADHQDAADYHGDLGEHGGDIGVYDASSEVDSGGSYDASYDATTSDYSTE
jgi:hypothetical protein